MIKRIRRYIMRQKAAIRASNPLWHHSTFSPEEIREMYEIETRYVGGWRVWEERPTDQPKHWWQGRGR